MEDPLAWLERRANAANPDRTPDVGLRGPRRRASERLAPLSVDAEGPMTRPGRPRQATPPSSPRGPEWSRLALDLPRGLCAALDEVATETGIARAELIRELVRAGLAALYQLA